MNNVRFEFSPSNPRLWLGRYSRIPGETTVFHVRFTRGQWWPFVDWTLGNATARCPMAEANVSPALAFAVLQGKKFLGGEQGGSFLINEYGQVLVPSPAGDGRVAVVGECRGPLVFQNEFNSGTLIDLTDDQTLKPGDAWARPYLGFRYNLSATSEIYFWKEDYTDGRKLTPAYQDYSLVDTIRSLRPRGPVRFVVTCGGLVLTKIPVGSWVESRWEPRFVGRLNYTHWYPKED